MREITLVEALTVARRVCDHLLTGSPARSTFDRAAVERAFGLVVDLREAHKGTSRGAALELARRPLAYMYWKLGPVRMRKRAPGKLSDIRAAVVDLIEETRQVEDDYWRAFVEEALGQAEAWLEVSSR